MQDTGPLDRIKEQRLLEASQRHLAIVAGLADIESPSAASAWRDALGTSTDTKTRISVARELLSSPTAQQDPRVVTLLKNDDAMTLVVEHEPVVWGRGNKAAHLCVQYREDYEGVIARLLSDADVEDYKKNGMEALVDFVCTD